MLKIILKRYLWIGILLNILLLVTLESKYILIYIFNILSIIAYYLVMYSKISKPLSYYQPIRLGLIVFFYSLFFVIAFNVISYFYNQNYYVFSESDALFYHKASLKMANEPFFLGLKSFFLYSTFEDLGAVLFISSLYQIIESNLIVNFFYLLSGVFASLFIFRIGRKFMSRKYAFIAALAYSLSSYVLWFHSSGLKESFMIFLVVLFYDQYYEFITRKKMLNIILMSFALLSILLFRPAITFLILASVFITLVLSRRKSLSIVIVIPFLFILLFFAYGYIEAIMNKFINPAGVTAMLQNKQSSGMVKLSIPLTIATNALSAFFGPFPTLIPNSKIVLSFYSVGLIFKVLLSVTFWIGAYQAYKRKMYKLLPLIFFVIFESFSLSYILEALELRKSLPHFFAVFIVSFWFLDFVNFKNSLSFKDKRSFTKLVKISSILFLLLILIWNLKVV